MLLDYELVKQVGRGAYGSVYLYKRKVDSKEVVIKQIPLDPITQDECQKTETEVKILAMLKHPFIIEYYESFMENGTMLIVMEYAPGGNLHDYLKSKGKDNRLDEEDVLHLFCQLALGIQHIHERQILHRDLKSHNVMLNWSHKIVKIGDFGISKILTSKSKADTVVGTPCYMSPEVCQEKPYNQKSDIWALGCILYELLTFNKAFEAEALGALIKKIMYVTIKPIPNEYSSEIRALVSSMLIKDPDLRPSIHQVISNPIIFPTLFKLHTTLGMVRCAAKFPKIHPEKVEESSGDVKEKSTE